MPIPEGCEVSLKATPTAAQGAEAAQSPAWQSLGTGWAQLIWSWGHLSSYVSPGPRMNVGAELEGSRAELSRGPQSPGRHRVGVWTCRAPCSHGWGQASKGAAGSSPSLDSASTFIPSQPSWLWGQRTLELEQAVTALSQAPCASPHGQGLRHHGSTGADPLHGI